MRKSFLIIWIIVAGLVLASVAGCGGAYQSARDEGLQGLAPAPPMEEAGGEKSVESSAASTAYDADTAYAAERLIIRTGNLSMAVEDTRSARATIEGMVQSMAAEGAFVVSADEHGGTEERQPYITISIRIPASRFGETMNRLAEMAVIVNSRNESSQDVTEEYVDLEARVESLETARQRLLKIIEEARSTKDLLEAEQQLTEREAEI